MLAWRSALFLSRQTTLLLRTPCAVWTRRSAVALVGVPARAFIAWVTFTSLSVSHRDVCASLISNIKAKAAAAARQRKMLKNVFMNWQRLGSSVPAHLKTSSLRSDSLAESLPPQAIADGRLEAMRGEALKNVFSLLLTPKRLGPGDNQRSEFERRGEFERNRHDARSRPARNVKEWDSSGGETLEDKVERLKSSVVDAMMVHEQQIEGEIHREQLLLFDALSASIGSQV